MKYLWMVLMIVALPSAPAFAQDDEKFSPALLEDARKGDANAQNELAVAYSEGKGVKPNQRRAVYWFGKSAEQGYAYGACNLGLHYGRGLGVPKNRTEALKWAFIASSLDGLRCNPADFIEGLKIKPCQVEEAWGLAVAWLRAHPKLENRNFGGRPWMEDDGEYAVTVRENGPSVELPIKASGKCRPKGKRIPGK